VSGKVLFGQLTVTAFFIYRYVLIDITKIQKKGGKSWNDSSLYPAPESDEWEEIDCDEAIQNFTTKIHICPHQQPGTIHIFKVCICQEIIFQK